MNVTSSEKERLNRIKLNLERRALIIDGIRTFFTGEGFLEVETPLRVPQVAPEANISPFGSEGCFLSTSPELYMKRLLASGYDKIFQICHSFRRGERGRQHQPEFTILEWYRSQADYLVMIQDTERMVLHLLAKLSLSGSIPYRGNKIDLSTPWPRISVRDAYKRYALWDPVTTPCPERFENDLVDKIIPGFTPDRPTVLLDYPAYSASLSRLKADDSQVAERTEVFIGGLEIANAFSELTDAAEQEARFGEEIERARLSGKNHFTLPRRFLEAMKRLPECAGIALGVDRLAMLFCDAASIDEVIAFPWGEESDLDNSETT